MSDDGFDNELDDEDKAILQQMQRLAEQIIVPGLSLPEIEALCQQIDGLGKKIKPKAWEYDFLVLQLMARQGTFLQDFDAFYRKRAELDRKIFDGDRHDLS